MSELLIATRNQGKMREIRQLCADLDLRITSLADYAGLPDIVEDGATFRDNAAKKAVTVARHTNRLTIGEDSGLEVKALGNKPGVTSARFSGGGATDRKNNAKLLRLLRGVPPAKRQARYRCCAVLADATGIIAVAQGSCGGFIATRPRGGNGFGYDPLFLVPRYKKTFGELDLSIKGKISHRARALRKIKKILVEYLSGSPVKLDADL